MYIENKKMWLNHFTECWNIGQNIVENGFQIDAVGSVDKFLLKSGASEPRLCLLDGEYVDFGGLEQWHRLVQPNAVQLVASDLDGLQIGEPGLNLRDSININDFIILDV